MPNPFLNQIPYLHVASHSLVVTAGVSDTFEAPSMFTGHVFVLGSGGDQQAVFLVGSDGNANFVGGGFKNRVAKSPNMSDVDIEQTGVRRWRMINAPDGLIKIALVGATEW